MNLSKLFGLQRKLDEHIEQEHPRHEGEDRLAKKILALYSELGELLNEWRRFKFWTHDQEPRFGGYCGCDDGYVDIYLGHGEVGQKLCPQCEGEGTLPNRVLEEFADCFHFLLSIGIELNFTDIDVWEVKEKTTTNQFIECFGRAYNMYIQISVTGEVPREMYEHLFAYFIGLGEMLGFSWVEIEQAYLEKNKINHERQESGY
jgi:dimeric dUTPase (all-alpha-NTP-PPase superfamily)